MADDLIDLVRSNPWLMRVLGAVRDASLPRRISTEQSRARLARHDPLTRWTHVTAVPPDIRR